MQILWRRRCSRVVDLKGRLHDRAKMARIRQKLERFQEFLQRNSEVLSVPQLVHRRLWTRHGTDKTSLFLCKNYWNRSSFCRIRAIFALSCKRPLKFPIISCVLTCLKALGQFQIIIVVETTDDGLRLIFNKKLRKCLFREHLRISQQSLI